MTQSGSTLVVLVMSSNAVSRSISDGVNTYTEVDSLDGSGMGFTIYLAENSSPVSALHAGYGASPGQGYVIAREYVGPIASPLDKHNAIPTTGTAPTVGIGTTTNADDLLIGYCLTTSAQNPAAGPGYANLYPAPGVIRPQFQAAMEDQTVSSAGVYDASFNVVTGAPFLIGGIALKLSGSSNTGNGPVLPGKLGKPFSVFPPDFVKVR